MSESEKIDPRDCPDTEITPAGAGSHSFSFEKNPELESLLVRINDFLRLAEQAQPPPPPLTYPLILLVGAPRSGTTLFMQWLNATGRIAVPSNLISRFYTAPAFGVMLQRMLTDPRYRYRDELDVSSHQPQPFESQLGKTKGLLGHNSFFYFWRQFIPVAESAPLPAAELARVDADGLRRAIARLAAEFGMPLAMKGYLVQYHLRLLEGILDRILFVHITRDPLAIMQSLLRVRRELYGDERKWWGCRPPGSEALQGLDPAVQVAGQIVFTDRSIRSELASIPAHKQLEVSYEQLCDDPAAIWQNLRAKLIDLSSRAGNDEILADAEYRGPQSFQRACKNPSGTANSNRILQALEIAKEML